MNGLRIMWSRLSWCSFIAPFFSAFPSMSLENHSLNSSCESKSEGMMKWRRAQSSCIEFWMGVPVRRSRLRQRKPRRVFQRALVELLIACASSRTMYCHLTPWKYFSS